MTTGNARVDELVDAMTSVDLADVGGVGMLAVAPAAGPEAPRQGERLALGATSPESASEMLRNAITILTCAGEPVAHDGVQFHESDIAKLRAYLARALARMEEEQFVLRRNINLSLASIRRMELALSANRRLETCS